MDVFFLLGMVCSQWPKFRGLHAGGMKNEELTCVHLSFSLLQFKISS